MTVTLETCYDVAMADVCSYEGCDSKLDLRNKTGRCKRHPNLLNPMECSFEGCTALIDQRATSGMCRTHRRDAYESYNLDKIRSNGRKASSRSYYRRANLLLEIKEAAGCTDCGIRDGRVLDFDHVRGEKKFNVGQFVYYSWSVVLEEIDKCDIRCANCHRIKTWERRQLREAL